MNIPPSARLARITKFKSDNSWDSLHVIPALKKYLHENKITTMVVNTCHSTFLRNMAIGLLFFPINIIGIIHFGEKIHSSITQKIISLKIKNYFVPNQYIIDNISPQNNKLKFREFFYLVFWDKIFPPTKTGNLIRIVIPGAIDFSRRDYLSLLQTISERKEKLSNLKFIFLGNCSTVAGQQLVNQAKNLNITNQCIFHDSYVPPDDFYREISRADLIMPLIHPNTDQYESFTKYSVSGAYSLAFGYRIPLLLFNDRLCNYEIFRDTALFYDYDTLGELLENIQSDKKQIEIKAKKYAEIEKLTIDYQAANYVDFIESR